MTSQQARELIENIQKNHPERWVAAVQTLIVDAIETNEKIEAKFEKLLKAVTHLAGIRPEAQATPEEAATIEGASDTGRATPLTPQQAAIEAEMDAAMGVAPPAAEPTRPGRRVVPPGRKAPARQVEAPVVGSDDSQAALEAQMNAAAGPRPE